MADTFYMTREEKRKAEERLEYLTTVKRAEIIERIQEARSHGDLSENAEYDAARNEQAANEGEILELGYQIKNAQIIEENDDNSAVHIGCKVTVREMEKRDGAFVPAAYSDEETYTIMGTTGADPIHNIISNESPVGAALLGKKKGAVVSVKAPDGEYYLKILAID